jgi:hypothetical protein
MPSIDAAGVLAWPTTTICAAASSTATRSRIRRESSAMNTLSGFCVLRTMRQVSAAGRPRDISRN